MSFMMPENKKQEHLFASVAGYRKVQSLAHKLKRGEQGGIREAAALMADAVRTLGAGRSAVLVPIPGHTGRATYTKDLCDEIGKLTAIPTADLLQGTHHLPLYEAKKNDMKPEGIRITYTLRQPLPEGKTAILVDNVLDTGHTAWAAVKAIGRADTRLAVLGNTRHYTLNNEVNFTQISVENMVNKKQVEVKQRTTVQGMSQTAPEEKAARQNTVTNTPSKEKMPTPGSLSAQYMDLKERHTDSVILFRQGDFYKALNSDAAKVSEALGIALIHPQNPDNGHLVAGFPHHALDTYLPKLIRAGYRIAIADPIAKKDIPQKEAIEADKKEAAEKKTSKSKGKEKAEPKAEQKAEDKAKTVDMKPKAPQLVTVNGEKVTHAHAFQSTKYPDTWYFTARLEGKQLRPMVMNPADVEAYKEKKVNIGDLMGKYYPTKMEKKVTPEQYKSDMTLSDGRQIEKMNVFKEKDENREDFGKYKLFAKVEGQGKGMAKVRTTEDLNAFFDRVTTPRQLVEKNFGERLNLASAYEKYKLPEEPKVSDIRITKDKDGEWRVSAKVGDSGRTDKKVISNTDRYSFFQAKTVTREQLAAKYLSADIEKAMGQKQEKKAGLKM